MLRRQRRPAALARTIPILPSDADEFGDAGLLHRHAIKHAAYFHGLAVVGDDDETAFWPLISPIRR